MTAPKQDIVSVNQEQDNFYHNLWAHDLRTQISAIISLTELIDKTGEAESRAPLVDALRLAARNAMAMLDRGTDAILPPSQQKVNLVHLLNQFSGLAKGLMRKGEIHFNLEIDPSLSNEPNVVIDPVQTHRILLLLLDNALKYAPKAEIFLKAERSGNRITVIFSDNGPGFGNQDPESLFQPYQRGKTDGSIEGRGLGLASIRLMLEKMKAEIKARQADEGGACFTITFTDCAMPENDQETQNQNDGYQIDEHAPQPKAGYNALSIMLVDDNKTNHLILGEMLKSLNCHVEHAYSAQDALARLARVQPDCLLVDIRMPDMDGWEFAKHFITLMGKDKAPLLYAISADRAPACFEPFSDWLQRPVEAGTLYKLVVDIASKKPF